MSAPATLRLWRVAVAVALMASLIGCTLAVTNQSSSPGESAPAQPTSGQTASPGSSAAPASASAEPTSSDVPHVGGETVRVVAVGDMASSNTQDDAVAALVESLRPEAFVALGDLVYPNGSLQNYELYYIPTFGRFDPIVWPTPGNHDLGQGAGDGYSAYFGEHAPHVPGGPYYAFELGPWRFYSLNSEIEQGNKGSAMYRWLRGQLEQNRTECIAAFWHSPIYTIGKKRYDEDGMRPIYDLLVENGVDLVLLGHDHNYQRWDVDGIAYFVVGTGGRSSYTFQSQDPKLVYGDDKLTGALELKLSAGGGEFAFHTTDGRVLDSGSFGC